MLQLTTHKRICSTPSVWPACRLLFPFRPKACGTSCPPDTTSSAPTTDQPQIPEAQRLLLRECGSDQWHNGFVQSVLFVRASWSTHTIAGSSYTSLHSSSAHRPIHAHRHFVATHPRDENRDLPLESCFHCGRPPARTERLSD